MLSLAQSRGIRECIASLAFVLVAGSHSLADTTQAYSNVFSIDTRADSPRYSGAAPRVASVARTAEGPFLCYIPLKNVFFVNVSEWGAEAGPGKVIYRLNGVSGVVRAQPYSTSFSLDMGRVLTRGGWSIRNRLLVRVVNSRGISSKPQAVWLESCDASPWLTGVALCLVVATTVRVFRLCSQYRGPRHILRYCLRFRLR